MVEQLAEAAMPDVQATTAERPRPNGLSELRGRVAVLYPQAEARPVRWFAVVGGVVVCGFAAKLSLARQDGPGALDMIWAEDGTAFYGGTLYRNPLDALFTPYNGYLHFVPRVLMEFVRLFPLADAAAAIAITGAVVSSALALLVYVASRDHLEIRTLRLAVSLPVVLIYQGQIEIGNNIVNIHWYLLYVALWMALWNPRERWRQVLAAGIVFCTVASDPLAAVYLPLVLMRMWTIRGWRGRLPALGLAAGLVFQAIGVVFRHSLDSRKSPSKFDVLWSGKGYVDETAGQVLFSNNENAHWRIFEPLSSHYVSWFLILAFVVAAVFRFTRPSWPLALVALAHSLALYAALTMKGGGITPRYAAPALLLLLVALAALARPKPGPSPKPALALLALVVLCIDANYDNPLRGGPSWTTNLDKAAASCGPGRNGPAVVEVAPARWFIPIPCDLVRHRNEFFQIGQFSETSG